MLTSSEFQQATGISNVLRDAWLPHISASMAQFGITTALRQAHFLAQVGHESAGFTKVMEGLNYSETALLATFKNRITAQQAKAYGRNNQHPANQQMIASIIYASRNGNGDVSSGDGYRYRGRGLIQITGRTNYSALIKQLGVDIVAQPDLLAGNKLAALSAAAWWKNNGLNEIADADDVSRITRIINGGLNGLDDRRTRLTKAKGVLCQS